MNRTQTTAEIATIFSVDVGTVGRWIRRGCPCTKPGKGKENLFLSSEVAAWMKSNGLTGNTGRPAETNVELLKQRLRKETALANRFEREEAIEAGKLHDVAACNALISGEIIKVRNRLLAMAATLAPQLDGLNGAEKQTLIERTIESILKEFSGRP